KVERVPRAARKHLQWHSSRDNLQDVLDFRNGRGVAHPDGMRQSVQESLGPGSLAISVFGQQDSFGLVQRSLYSLRDWHVSRFDADRARETAAAGAHRRLASDGSNLANVLQYLAERSPEDLADITGALRRQVPQAAGLDAQVLPDDRLLLRLRDEPFEGSVLARFVSE